MAEMTCVGCEQPSENCGRAERKKTSFNVIVVHGFLHGVNVPCSFRERLNKFTKNWLVARTPNFRKYDLFLRKDRLRTYICGPYWKSLIRAYDIELGDVVHFEYNEDSLDRLSNLFNVTVYKNNIEKAVVEETVVGDMPSSIRSILYRTVFTDINSVTEQEMAAILFGIYKDVYVTEHEFYELKHEKNFWVHKMDEDSQEFEAFYMPSEAVDGYRYPVFGKANLSRNGQPLEGEEEDFIDCTYKIEWELGHVCFQNGWTDFVAAAHIGVDPTVLIKIYPMQEYISLNFVEIIN